MQIYEGRLEPRFTALRPAVHASSLSGAVKQQNVMSDCQSFVNADLQRGRSHSAPSPPDRLLVGFISLPDGGEVSLQQSALHRGRVEQTLHRVLQTPRRQRSLAGGGLEAVRDRQGESDQNDQVDEMRNKHKASCLTPNCVAFLTIIILMSRIVCFRKRHGTVLVIVGFLFCFCFFRIN